MACEQTQWRRVQSQLPGYEGNLDPPFTPHRGLVSQFNEWLRLNDMPALKHSVAQDVKPSASVSLRSVTVWNDRPW